MSSSGLITQKFQNMTKDNKQHEHSNSTNTAIAYSTCYVQCGDNLELLKSQPNESVNMIYCDILYGTGRNFGDYQDLKPIRSEIESHYIPRLIEMKRVLKQNGTLYLHCDWRIIHWMRVLCDDMFIFQNEVIWVFAWGIRTTKKWNNKHNNILMYTKSQEFTFNSDKVLIKRIDLNNKGEAGTTLKNKRGYSSDALPIDVIYQNQITPTAKEQTGYATQKPKELIRHFVLASTNEGDVVADYYLGSGTTAKVCQELNRKFIGCDLNPKVIEITKARLNGGQ